MSFYNEFTKEQLIDRIEEMDCIIRSLQREMKKTNKKFACLAQQIADMYDEINRADAIIDECEREKDYWRKQYVKSLNSKEGCLCEQSTKQKTETSQTQPTLQQDD